MRKKALLEQIDALIKKNDELYKDNVCLANELEKKKEIIKELQKKADSPAETVTCFPAMAPDQLAVSETESESEKQQLIPDIIMTEENGDPVLPLQDETAYISDNGEDETVAEPEPQTGISETFANLPQSDVDLGSRAIGEVVVRCASLCNDFTASGGQNAKDLVNLALGRTEVFKSDILSLVSDGGDDRLTAEKIGQLKNSVFDYFDLLKEQM